MKRLKTLVGIYLDLIRSPADEETRETSIRYLFDFLNLILSKSNGLLSRNMALFPDLIDSLIDYSRKEVFPFQERFDLWEKTPSDGPGAFGPSGRRTV